MLSSINIVINLRQMGLLEFVSQHDDNCFIVKPKRNWTAIAREGSKFNSSEWLVRANAVCSKKGTKTFWLMSEEAYQDVKTSRSICKEFTGKEGGYSVAGNARRVWEWALSKDPQGATVSGIMQGRDFGYHQCIPGFYPNMCAFDLKAAYWNAIWRLETRKFQEVKPGELLKLRETNDEKARMRDLREALNEFKLMRNCVWGAMLGGVENGWCYKSGAKATTRRYPGTHRGAALLVARCISEATQLQAFETDSPYTMTDCVIMKLGDSPKLWDEWGLKWDIKGVGDADIKFRHAYRVGSDWIGHYSPEDEHTVEVLPAPLPERLFLKEYLL